MKRITYILAIVGTIFMGCNPIEDIYDDIDAQVNPIVGSAEYTLTNDDYDELELGFGSFSSEDDAKAALPGFLSDLYPTWGEGSSVLVGYDLFIGSAEGISDYSGADHYFLSEADYTLSGSDVLGFYPDVDASDYLADILTANIVAPEEGQIELVRYVQYTEVPDVFISTNYVIEENFDYEALAGNLTDITSNWTDHSGGSPFVGYATSSLSMTDYPSSGIGGAATIDGSGSEDVNREFSEISSGNVYFSALVNLSAVSTGTYFFHVKNEGFDYRGRVGAMTNGSGQILFGIGASSSSLTYGTTAYDLDTTYLLVASYNIDTGVSNLYVLTATQATEPAIPEATNSGNSGTPISAVAFRQSSSGGATGTIDGVRVATSWDAIMVNDVAIAVTGDKINSEIFYTYSGGEWDETEGVYFVQDTDFDSMGEGSGQPGRFNNFGSSTPAEDYLPTFLSLTSPWAFGLEEDEVIMIYDYFSSSSGAQIRGNLYTIIDGMWTPHTSVISTTLQFGHDGNTWVPDNTIRYTLTGADISLISETFSTIYPGPASNVGRFGSFDRRSGSDNFWSDEMLLEAFNVVLDNLDPSAQEEQKYVLTYVVFIGSLADESMSVIKTSGVWVYQ